MQADKGNMRNDFNRLNAEKDTTRTKDETQCNNNKEQPLVYMKM